MLTEDALGDRMRDFAVTSLLRCMVTVVYPCESEHLCMSAVGVREL